MKKVAVPNYGRCTFPKTLCTLIIITLTMTMQSQTDDRQQIRQLYETMYQAMVAKDTATLNCVYANEMVLVHITGMRQSKKEYLDAIADGTLNYYTAVHEQTEVTVEGDRATLTGRSRVTAAVFGGGHHTWPLQLCFRLVRRDGRWQFVEARASTY